MQASSSMYCVGGKTENKIHYLPLGNEWLNIFISAVKYYEVIFLMNQVSLN